VVIVGGGVIGLAVGWRAARSGLSVIVLERGEPGAATSRVAAGMIAPIAEAEPAEPALVELARASAALYPGFVEELRSESGCDPFFLTCGTLLVARDADEAAALERELEFRRGLELPVTRLRPSEARALEPALAPTVRLAADIPSDHAIDPRALCEALARALRAAGGKLRARIGVEELILTRDRVEGVRLANGEIVRAERTVIAAGPWSGQLRNLPERAQVPLRPVKGQIMSLRDPAGPGLIQRVIRMQPGYLVPRGDGRYVLGATVEERGFDTTLTAGAIWGLLRDAIELVPGVAEMEIEELMAGLRPGTPDNAPILGPGALEGLVWATGHYRHGILLAPVTAAIIVAQLRGEGAADSAAAYRPERFATAGMAA
jgi:glycine oxidase